MTQSDLELLERVNPVFNTAKTMVYQLAMIGNKDAEELASKLGLTFEQTQNSKNVVLGQDEEIQSGANVVEMTYLMEMRYRTMMEMALASGYPVEVDLPCGFTPRAVEFAHLGKAFVGLDLPATIVEAEPAIRSMLQPEEQQLVNFYAVDATNYTSMKEAFDKIDGSVCITTEGLLMYLTESELSALADNIKRILDEHDGCWITADPECFIQYILILEALVGEDAGEVLLRDQVRMGEKSDIKMDGNCLSIAPGPTVGEDIQKAVSFLTAHGLKVERIPVADHMPELNSMNGLPEEQVAQIKQSMKQCCFWKMTSTGEPSTERVDVDGFSITSSVDGDVLRMKLTGRLDTLTAPQLLNAYEALAAECGFKGIIVGCENLEYVSSAGLRVWLIMHKACEEGLTLTGANEMVTGILAQTGYDQFIQTR